MPARGHISSGAGLPRQQQSLSRIIKQLAIAIAIAFTFALTMACVLACQQQFAKFPLNNSANLSICLARIKDIVRGTKEKKKKSAKWQRIAKINTQLRTKSSSSAAQKDTTSQAVSSWKS